MNAPDNEPADVLLFNKYRLSWLAYIRAVLIFCVLAFIGLGVNGALSVMVFVIALAVLIYQVLHLRSTILFTNEDGVWLFSGVLPWNKGAIGVKWCDISEAAFFPGFVSWACNSYSVRVGHRYTRTSQIFIANVENGLKAVEHINGLHQAILAASRP